MDKKEKKLLSIFSRLNPADMDSVQAFAEFLLSRSPGAPAPVEPLDMPRPPEETVPSAIRRLSRTYPMLDKTRYLGRVSEFMNRSIIGGEKAESVIDDLEKFFREAYLEFRRDSSGEEEPPADSRPDDP